MQLGVEQQRRDSDRYGEICQRPLKRDLHRSGSRTASFTAARSRAHVSAVSVATFV